MKLHRFFIENSLTLRTLTVLDAALCHQLYRVLRMRPGDHIVLVDGKGSEAEAEIVSIAPKRVELRCEQARTVVAEPSKAVTLYCAVLKRENMEWVAQKAVECGIGRIVPVLTARTVKTGIKLERLRAIVREAAEQSGRGRIPSVDEPMTFSVAAESATGKQLFFDFGGTEAWQQVAASQEHVGCWVGPEGGWTPQERAAAEAAGWTVASLGALTLRAETAAVLAAYLAVHAG